MEVEVQLEFSIYCVKVGNDLGFKADSHVQTVA